MISLVFNPSPPSLSISLYPNSPPFYLSDDPSYTSFCSELSPLHIYLFSMTYPMLMPYPTLVTYPMLPYDRPTLHHPMLDLPYISPTLCHPTWDLPYAALCRWPTLCHPMWVTYPTPTTYPMPPYVGDLPYADDLPHTNDLPNSKDLLNSEFLVCLWVISGCSAWKSSPKTGKRLRLDWTKTAEDWTKTAEDWKFPGLSKTATAVRSSVSNDFGNFKTN